MKIVIGTDTMIIPPTTASTIMTIFPLSVSKNGLSINLTLMVMFCFISLTLKILLSSLSTSEPLTYISIRFLKEIYDLLLF